MDIKNDYSINMFKSIVNATMSGELTWQHLENGTYKAYSRRTAYYFKANASEVFIRTCGETWHTLPWGLRDGDNSIVLRTLHELILKQNGIGGACDVYQQIKSTMTLLAEGMLDDTLTANLLTSNHGQDSFIAYLNETSYRIVNGKTISINVSNKNMLSPPTVYLTNKSRHYQIVKKALTHVTAKASKNVKATC